MKEESYILKERVKSLVNGRKVISALFYTFNFDPKFFENYVMPLLVPEMEFTNNNIANNIIWRRLYKDNKVPSITIYFDQDAKGDNGPMLDYKLVPVNMPMVGKNKGNFHPKHSFILVEDSVNQQELIVITGSNNITQGGWCENIECVAEQLLINNKEFPYEFKTSLRTFITSCYEWFGRKNEWSTAEELVFSYLNKIGTTKEREMYFFNSYTSSFPDFIKNNILVDPTVNKVEIISPYFSNNPEILNEFIERKLKICIQAPFSQGYCLLKKEVFDTYRENNVKWYFPEDETRNTHSKVYSFFGDSKVYTIIGSVNLTDPAWSKVEAINKRIFNVESAVLFVNKKEDIKSILFNEIKNVDIKFIETTGLETENWHERIEIPEIDFLMDWNTETLSWRSKIKNTCELHLNDKVKITINNNKSIDLMGNTLILNSIAKKPILKVIESFGNESRTHLYYINQLGFQKRPMEFKISTSDIIDAWELLGKVDSELNDWLINRLEQITEQFQDENGVIVAGATVGKSLLNEMARHFYGLSKLESFLKDSSMERKPQHTQISHFNNIKYYLTYDNVDTLYSYYKNIFALNNEEYFLKVYYWLLIEIIDTNLYSQDMLSLAKNLKGISKEEFKEFKIAFEGIKTEIQKEIAKISIEVVNTGKLDKRQIRWALTVLNNEYA